MVHTSVVSDHMWLLIVACRCFYLTVVCTGHPLAVVSPVLSCVGASVAIIYLEKMGVFKAGIFAMNHTARNNKIGLWSYACWFLTTECND